MKVESTINNNEFGVIFTILIIGVKQVYNLLIDVLDAEVMVLRIIPI
jgi:hypothetical protein